MQYYKDYIEFHKRDIITAFFMLYYRIAWNYDYCKAEKCDINMIFYILLFLFFIYFQKPEAIFARHEERSEKTKIKARAKITSF